MDKEKISDSYATKQIKRNQIITVEDLKAFEHTLLISIRTLFAQYATPTQKKWLKTYEVKQLLGISNGTLQTMRSNGTIPFSKVGGTIYYDLDEVNRALEEQKRDLKSLGNPFINNKNKK